MSKRQGTRCFASRGGCAVTTTEAETEALLQQIGLILRLQASLGQLLADLYLQLQLQRFRRNSASSLAQVRRASSRSRSPVRSTQQPTTQQLLRWEQEAATPPTPLIINGINQSADLGYRTPCPEDDPAIVNTGQIGGPSPPASPSAETEECEHWINEGGY